ncbi:MAG TPA: hypothetical protein DEO70_05325 [Bacteroidales bacterium]|nr:hypothetical protein [Bacteroidales bacterium]
MKKIFVLGLFTLHFFMTLQCQEKYQIDSTSKWIQEEEWVATFEYEKYNFALTLKNDTIINGAKYFKMFMDGQFYWDYRNFGSGIDTISNLYYGAVREDSGKILLILPDSNSYIALYDFNYNVSDTIHTLVGNGLIIQDIETLEDGRKKYITNSPGQLFIVEGIGSNHGFYSNPNIPSPQYLIDTVLGCYYQNDSLIFINDPAVCYFQLPIGIVDEVMNSIYLFPNPASNIIKIVIDDPITSLEIIDINCNIQNVVFERPNLVNVSSLCNGIYLMIVNKKQRIKFIKK